VSRGIAADLQGLKYWNPVVQQSSENAAKTGHGEAQKNPPGERDLDLHQVRQPAAFGRLQAEVEKEAANRRDAQHPQAIVAAETAEAQKQVGCPGELAAVAE